MVNMSKNLKKCKQCDKVLFFSLSGLRDFCSDKCKKLYRQTQKNDWQRGKRHEDKRGGYVDMDEDKIPENNSEKSITLEGENDGLKPSEVNSVLEPPEGSPCHIAGHDWRCINEEVVCMRCKLVVGGTRQCTPVLPGEPFRETIKR
jgi:hypothetical protein